MSESVQSVNTLDKIAKALPSEVLEQRIFKAKVLFLGVDKKDPGYSKIKKFSANCHNYQVIDGETSYLPEEAYNALKGAVSYINKPRLDWHMDDPRDKYERVPDARFDITIFDEMKVVINEDGVRTLKSNSEVTKLELEETNKGILVEEKKRIEAEVRAEYEAKFKNMKNEIPEATPEDEIEDLLNETILADEE